MARQVYLSIDRDGATGCLQISINDGNGGYRIHGPKYAGGSRNLARSVLTQRDVQEIRAYLRRVPKEVS